jgi:predicted amidohydrolase
MQDLRITWHQTPLHWENPKANARLFLEENEYPETDLILLPEMFTTGFSMRTELAEEAGETALNILRSLARKTGAAVCGSSMYKDGDRFYNRLIFQKPDEKPLFYDKRHLFSLAGEEKKYTPGNTRLVAEWKSWKIFPLVCYDLRFPVWSRRTPENEYEVMLFLANWPDRRSYAWRTLLKARAIENQAYVVGVNRVGADGNGIPHAGDSCAVSFSGKILRHSVPFRTEVQTVSLNKESLLRFRERLPFFNDGDSFLLNGK